MGEGANSEGTSRMSVASAGGRMGGQPKAGGCVGGEGGVPTIFPPFLIGLPALACGWEWVEGAGW